LLTVLLAHGSAAACRERLRTGERAESVEAEAIAECRYGSGVPLPGLGESAGGVVVRADAWEAVAEDGQVGGEGVGERGGEGGEVQAAVRGAVEGGADLVGLLQPAEDGGLGAVRGRAAGSQVLGHRQRQGVQGRSRAQEITGSGEKVVDVFGEVPVSRAHASCFLKRPA
jgi:hypothetical protein